MYEHKEHGHREHERRTGLQDGVTGGDRSRDERLARAAAAQRIEWASDRTLDPGDSHDKGEASLCVGEAA